MAFPPPSLRPRPQPEPQTGINNIYHCTYCGSQSTSPDREGGCISCGAREFTVGLADAHKPWVILPDFGEEETR